MSVANVLLNTLEAATVLEGARDEGRAHRVRGEATGVADGASNPLAKDLVDEVRSHVAAGVVGDLVATKRAEERSLGVVAVSGDLEVVADAPLRLRVQRHAMVFASLADVAKARHPPMLLDVAHGHVGNLCPSGTDLQAHGQDGAVSQASLGVGRRGVEDGAGLLLREGRGLARAAVDARPGDVAHGVVRDKVLLDEVAVEAGERGELAPQRGGLHGTGLEACPPCEHGRGRHGVELLASADVESSDEVAHVLAVGLARALAA